MSSVSVAPSQGVEEEKVKEIDAFFVANLEDDFSNLKMLQVSSKIIYKKERLGKTFYYIPIKNKMIKIWKDTKGNLLITVLPKKVFFVKQYERLHTYILKGVAKTQSSLVYWGVDNPLEEGEYNIYAELYPYDQFYIKFRGLNPLNLLEGHEEELMLVIYLLYFQ